MYLTKINKLIWIVFLLPCIQAQLNEFTFSPDTHKTHVNVLASYDVKLTCVTGFENIEIITSDGDIIVDGFNLVDHSDIYSYTYDNTDRNRVINVLTIKYTRENTRKTYTCYGGDTFAYELNLRTYYPPARPVCKTTQSSTTVMLTCRSEVGNPRVSMSIYGPNRTYILYNILEDFNTHISRRVYLAEYKENIKCMTTYNFIQNDMVYTTKYICAFNDIARPTTAPAITNSTLNVDNQLISSSTIPKYSIFTLVIAILSRTI